VAAWHAAARSDRILVVHSDGTATEVPVEAPASTVAAVRASAVGAIRGPAVGAIPASAVGATGGNGIGSTPAATVFAATVDPERLASIAGTDVAEGSLALLVDGQAGAPWTPVTVPDLLSGLTPVPA